MLGGSGASIACGDDQDFAVYASLVTKALTPWTAIPRQ